MKTIPTRGAISSGAMMEFQLKHRKQPKKARKPKRVRRQQAKQQLLIRIRNRRNPNQQVAPLERVQAKMMSKWRLKKQRPLPKQTSNQTSRQQINRQPRSIKARRPKLTHLHLRLQLRYFLIILLLFN